MTERGSAADFETEVKLALYAAIAETTRVPDAAALASVLGRSMGDVEQAFAGLRAKRLVALEPGSTSRIRMAPPFSAIETPFRVRAGGRQYHANCVWDALGIPAALHADGEVDATDGHTGEPMRLEVRNGQPVRTPCLMHYAVPAARWWDDIIHT